MTAIPISDTPITVNNVETAVIVTPNLESTNIANGTNTIDNAVEMVMRSIPSIDFGFHIAQLHIKPGTKISITKPNTARNDCHIDNSIEFRDPRMRAAMVSAITVDNVMIIYFFPICVSNIIIRLPL